MSRIWNSPNCRQGIWLLAMAAAGLAPVSRSSAATLPTTISSVSSEFNTGVDRRAVHAVDGSGLDSSNPPQHTNQPNSLMWLNEGDGSFSGGAADPHPNGDLAQITFDLGGSSPVGSFRVWNYNELNGFNDRSVKTLTISSATSAGGPYTLLTDPINNSTTWTFDQAPGTAVYTGQFFAFPATFTAGFIRFDILSNYDSGGTDHGFVGLSEIQFFNAVPEPSSFILLSFGVLGLLACARVPLLACPAVDSPDAGLRCTQP